MIEIKYINFIEYSKEYPNVSFHIHDCYEFVYYHKGTGKILTKDKITNKNHKNTNFLKSKFLQNHDIIKESIMYLPSLDEQNKTPTLTETFSPNTYYLYEPYVPHSEIHSNPPIITTIGFTLTNNKPIKMGKYNDAFMDIENLLNRIKEEYFNAKSLYLEAIKHYFSLILLIAERSFKETASNNFSSLEYAKNYIDQYFTTDINFNQLASTCGYCLDHFRVLFKNKFGTSLKQYVLNSRIEFAKKQLINTDLSINEITYNCGYDSYKQFATVFKNHTGYSFGEYRELFNKTKE